MSVSLLTQQRSNYSARSISGISAISLGGRAQGRISTSPFQTRTPSVYGGAGGYGTRISQSTSVSSAGSLTLYGESGLLTDGKVTMQNLNDRLASYLAKVRSLEGANRKLDLQIREFNEKSAPTASKDFTGFFATITDLRAQIAKRYAENQRVLLQIDNAHMSVEDFKMKYEIELNMHTLVEADVTRLRGVRDGITLAVSGLEMQIEDMKEEIAYMKNNHEEEMRQMRAQQTGGLNVEMDSPESVDLTKVLQEMREQYETVMTKNKLEVEKWFQTKVETLKTQISSHSTVVKTSNTQLSELKRTYQNLEICLQSVHAEIQLLQQNVEEVKSRYSVQLSQLQMTITTLETELQLLKVSIEQQQASYSLLLDIKMRLEMEIAEYRRLLDGESYGQTQVVVISKVEVEETKPHIERRVKTIVEEIVDGQVVSSSVDTKVEILQ